MNNRPRKFYGWGYADEALSVAEVEIMERRLAERFGVSHWEVTPPPRPEEFQLPASRIDSVPTRLEPLISTQHLDRLEHSYGQMFVDVARMFERRCPNPPDAVAKPRRERDVADILDWCSAIGAVAIPYGGGTSMVGGIEPPPRAGKVVTIDMRGLDVLLEVDTTSCAAHFQAGVVGADIERSLLEHGLFVRHDMPSFPLSTLGGWIATRACGNFTAADPFIDALVESLRAVTPRGILETRRRPAPGPGISPDRLLIGSEGTLGIIIDAWIRVARRPKHRKSACLRFPSFNAGADAARAVAQAELRPAQCQLLEARDASTHADADDRTAVLMLGFESIEEPLEAALSRAVQVCEASGGREEASTSSEEAGNWRTSFLRTPYYTEHLVARGVATLTLESTITWDRFNDFRANVMEAARHALRDATRRDGHVSCRLDRVHPDGPAASFTVSGVIDRRAVVEQFGAIQGKVNDAVVANGGTITSYGGVGRAHRAHPADEATLLAEALRAAKAALDPKRLLNPGVLV